MTGPLSGLRPIEFAQGPAPFAGTSAEAAR
jgi:hypothetical protein